MPSPRVYITVSRSGQTLSPCTQMSSAVLATTVTAGGPHRCARQAQDALQEPGAADASGEDGDALEGASWGSNSGVSDISAGESGMTSSVDQFGSNTRLPLDFMGTTGM